MRFDGWFAFIPFLLRDTFLLGTANDLLKIAFVQVLALPTNPLRLPVASLAAPKAEGEGEEVVENDVEEK